MDKDVCLVRPAGRGVLNDGFDIDAMFISGTAIKMLRDCQSRALGQNGGFVWTLIH